MIYRKVVFGFLAFFLDNKEVKEMCVMMINIVSMLYNKEL